MDTRLTPCCPAGVRSARPSHLHYWLAHTTAADAGPDTPVVLWLNGGPGSSSILGMLQELGPLLINQTGGLFRNPYAWTTDAHVLVLESPAGVGYSYCAAMTTGKGGCMNTDKSTAAAARAALQYFFKEKFPGLAKNPFFVTGESCKMAGGNPEPVHFPPQICRYNAVQ